MDVPSVSIILPTQGLRASLAPALSSALGQDFPSIEVVLVDDSINRGDWAQRPDLAALLSDPRVRVVPFHQGRGCPAAKNAGLRAARGEWICYLDDDNRYHPEKVGAQHALAVASGSPLVLCGLEFRMQGRRRQRQTQAGRFSGDELLLTAHADTNVLFHRRASAPEWDEDLGTADDACYFQALLRRHGLASVPNVPRALVIYHAHAGPRANRAFERIYRGQRRLLVRWTRVYGGRAREIHRLRVFVSFTKFQNGGWGRLLALGCRLLRVGGWREWRTVANAAGVRTPVLRRWMVT